MTLPSKRLQLWLACGVYVTTTLYLMWPAPEHPGSVIYGKFGDLTGSIATYRELAQGHHNPFLPGLLPDFDAPHGQPITWALNVATLPSTAFIFGLTLVIGAVSAYAVYTFLGYVASGLAMFLLARKITGHFGAALIAGWAFAFYPFAVVNGGGHNAFVHGWVLVLLVWRMLELGESPTRRNGLLAGAATALCFLWTPYFILIGGVAYATLAGITMLASARRGTLRSDLTPQLFAAAAVALVLIVLLAVNGASSDSTLRQNGLDALYIYSARPAEYLLPTAGPVSRWTEPYLNRHAHGSNPSEDTIYVGLSTIVLAALGFAAALRSRTSLRARRAVLAAAALVVVALAFSAPPHGNVLGLRLPLPSLLVYDLTPTWRVFSRFVIVVMLGLCLMAAGGLAVLTRGRRPRVAASIVVASGAVLVVDLWARDGNYHTSLAAPAIYQQLRKLPPGIVAEYPLQPFGYGLYEDLYFQQAHGHPVLNGYPAGSREEKRALSLADVAKPSTARALAALGVRYILVRDRPDGGTPASLTPGGGFSFVGDDRYASLYRVADGAPRIVTARPASGFGRRERGPDGSFAWMIANPGFIDITGSCKPCRGTLTFHAQSFFRPRWLVLRGPGVSRPIRLRVDAQGATIHVPLRFAGRTRLRLSTDLGPQSVVAAIGGVDKRRVSINVAGFVFAPGTGQRGS